MQQTQAASNAAHRVSYHDPSPDTADSTGQQDKQSFLSGLFDSDSAVGDVLESVIDAAGSVYDVIQDIFQHAEAR